MKEINALGKKCPQPIIDLSVAMKSDLTENQFRLLSDDLATWSDLSAWSRMTGHIVKRDDADTFQITRSEHN